MNIHIAAKQNGVFASFITWYAKRYYRWRADRAVRQSWALARRFQKESSNVAPEYHVYIHRVEERPQMVCDCDPEKFPTYTPNTQGVLICSRCGLPDK